MIGLNSGRFSPASSIHFPHPVCADSSPMMVTPRVHAAPGLEPGHVTIRCRKHDVPPIRPGSVATPDRTRALVFSRWPGRAGLLHTEMVTGEP